MAKATTVAALMRDWRKARPVSELMREWRTVAGLSTSEAGERIGLSGRTVEQIEQGRRRDGDVLTALALQALIAEARGD